MQTQTLRVFVCLFVCVCVFVCLCSLKVVTIRFTFSVFLCVSFSFFQQKHNKTNFTKTLFQYALFVNRNKGLRRKKQTSMGLGPTGFGESRFSCVFSKRTIIAVYMLFACLYLFSLTFSRWSWTRWKINNIVCNRVHLFLFKTQLQFAHQWQSLRSRSCS